MGFNSFSVKINDTFGNPIENAVVCTILYNYSGQTSYYTSGLTNVNGKIFYFDDNSTCSSCTINAFDTENYIETKNNYFTIEDGDEIDITMENQAYSGFYYSFKSQCFDELVAVLQGGKEPIDYPINVKVSEVSGNVLNLINEHIVYDLNTITSGYSKTLTIHVNLHPFEEYHSSGHKHFLGYEIGNIRSFEELCIKNFYDFKLPLINDTINWNSNYKTLKNTNVSINVSNYIDTGITDNNYISYVYRGSPSVLSILKNGPIYLNFNKNHYIPKTIICAISGNSVNNLYFVDTATSGRIESSILQREPNVCMVNQDLYDYAISIDSLVPNMNNFEYALNKVGVANLPYYNNWVSAVTDYLPSQYQGTTISTLQEFKDLFVSLLSTENVETLYTLTPLVEEYYLEDSNHGFVWDRCFVPKQEDYLTFMSYSGDVVSNVRLTKVGNPTEVQLEYNFNGNGWEDYTIGTNISLSNEYVKFRRKNTDVSSNFSTGSSNYYNFDINTNEIYCYGSVTSLLDGNGSDKSINLTDYCFYGLFSGCTKLITPPKLIPERLKRNCYSHMFSDCTSLTTMPELHSINLGTFCYSRMFFNCTSLTTVSNLPAENLTEGCYHEMFRECTSLTTTPLLNARNVSNLSCYQMFYGCTALTTVYDLYAENLSDNCYRGMFNNCISLTTAPNLPATNLAYSCYKEMFLGCISLTTVHNLPATTLADYCYDSMFSGCTSLTTAPKLSATNLAEYCYCSMFYGCVSLVNTQPTLHATTLVQGCYTNMFRGCSSLENPPILPAENLVTNCYGGMFHSCSNLKQLRALFITDIDSSPLSYTQNWLFGVPNDSSRIFYKNSNATWTLRNEHGIPSNWTVITV